MGVAVGAMRLTPDSNKFINNLIVLSDEDHNNYKLKTNGNQPLREFTWSDFFRVYFYKLYYTKTREERVQNLTEFLHTHFGLTDENGETLTKEQILELVTNAINGDDI